MPPMINPPRAPDIRIGRYAFVMIASGTLRSRPMTRPMSHPGHGNCTSGITKPIPKRLKKAASNAVRLSGKDIGSIRATSTAPKMRPQTRPSTRRDTRGIRANSRGIGQDQYQAELGIRGRHGGRPATIGEKACLAHAAFRIQRDCHYANQAHAFWFPRNLPSFERDQPRGAALAEG